MVAITSASNLNGFLRFTVLSFSKADISQILRGCKTMIPLTRSYALSAETPRTWPTAFTVGEPAAVSIHKHRLRCWVLTASPDGPCGTDHARGRSCNYHASSIAGTALRVEMPVETGALESLPEVVFTRIRQMTRQSRVHLRLFLA